MAFGARMLRYRQFVSLASTGFGRQFSFKHLYGHHVSPKFEIPRRFFASGSNEEETVKRFKEGDYSVVANPSSLKHFKSKGEKYDEATITLPHPIWTDEETNSIQPTHRDPQNVMDRLAYWNIVLLRNGFDIVSLFVVGQRTEKKWIRRVIFLETVAGVPGMVGAMMRHLKSLRAMTKDHGWIHTLLQEAENERMHLMTAMEVQQPGLIFKVIVFATQLFWLPAFSLLYLISPRYCHRFVGYLEEEAVKTYTKCLEDIENEKSSITHWKTVPAPDIAIRYWQLVPTATLKDVILAIRADEDHHREVNHVLAALKVDDVNPFYEPSMKIWDSNKVEVTKSSENDEIKDEQKSKSEVSATTKSEQKKGG